jgi:formiminotetrahydrofolate cyclodeaminase
MAASIWKSTLEEFRGQLASRDSVPAGVSVAAVSASLALGLLMKVLEITRKRREFQGDPQKIEELLAAVRTASNKLSQYADEDIVAFAEYMASRGSPAEEAALQKAIEIPLGAARAAATGLRLCAEVAGMVPASIAPDLGTAALLLGGSVQAMLLSVNSNALRLSDTQSQDQLRREVETLRELAKKHQRW